MWGYRIKQSMGPEEIVGITHQLNVSIEYVLSKRVKSLCPQTDVTLVFVYIERLDLSALLIRLQFFGKRLAKHT